jgi:hypothetical protein
MTAAVTGYLLDLGRSGKPEVRASIREMNERAARPARLRDAFDRRRSSTLQGFER